jgi:hypothetical protein
MADDDHEGKVTPQGLTAAQVAALIAPSYSLWFRRQPADLASVVWVAGVDTACDDAFLGSHGILGIVNCAGPECRGSSPLWQMRRYLELQARDEIGYDIMQHVPAVTEFCRAVMVHVAAMDGSPATKPRILIHCHAGMNRSPAIAVAVVHTLTGTPVADLLCALAARRPVLTNTSFQSQVAEFSRQLWFTAHMAGTPMV